MRKCAVFSLAFLVSLVATTTVHAGVIQDAIDSAAPGDIVVVSAGTYEESIVLKDGIALVGEGAEDTIIDGGGAGAVVTGGKDSLIVGFTVRNGQVGIQNYTNTISVFECVVTDCTKRGIHIKHGFAVLGHNLVRGDKKSIGILSQVANPYVFDTVIVDHLTGFWSQGELEPSLVGNLFVGNEIAIRVDGSKVQLDGNSFYGNNKNIMGQELSESDVVLSSAPSTALPDVEGTVEGYRELIKRISADKLSEHPVVIYVLEDLVGDFGMAVLNSRATFNVAASTPDTEVVAYDAVDLETAEQLNVKYNGDSRPLMQVRNPQIKAVDHERFALDTTFRHGPSYYAGAEGRLVFDRLTSITRIEVLLPEGYLPASISHPATQEWVGNRLAVKIMDVGYTNVRIAMDPVAGE